MFDVERFGTSVDIILNAYEQNRQPQFLTDSLSELIEETILDENALGHLKRGLNKVQEGYTLLKGIGKKIGIDNPLGYLGVSEQDYIAKKAAKLEVLLAKDPIPAKAIKFHLYEIFLIGKEKGIDISEIVYKLFSTFLDRYNNKA